MTKSGAILAAISAAALLAATAATTPADAATRSNGRVRTFDGLWSVSIYTQTGPCAPSYRYPARIFESQVMQAEPSNDYQISGAVAANGAIGVTVSTRGQNATGYGRLTRTQGGGWWRTQYGDCTGVWQAIRR
jgi:hypothetical protein